MYNHINAVYRMLQGFKRNSFVDIGNLKWYPFHALITRYELH